MSDQDDCNHRTRSDVNRWSVLFFTLLVQAGAGIWWASDLTSRVVAIEEWRSATAATRYTLADGRSDQVQAEAERRIMRRELEAEIAANRAFIRSLCFAVSSLQDIEGIPRSNDCGRP